MDENKRVTKSVGILKSQEDFLMNEHKFNLSKFVQAKLAEYIKFRQDYQQFMSSDNFEVTGSAL